MDELIDSIVSELGVWAGTEFTTRAQANEALFALSPVGARTEELLQAAMVEVGLTPAAMVAYIEAHPDAVDRQARRLSEHLERALASYRDRIAVFEKLPPGDVDGATRRIAARLRAHTKRTAPAPRPDTLQGWTEVTSRDHLRTLVSAAVDAGAPVIVHVRADWATPAIALEDDVLSNPEVSARLRAYHRLYVDVSDASDDDDEVQVSLGTEDLPAILVYADPAPLASFLAGRGPRPAPTAHIGRLVDVSTFLARLPAP